MDRSDLVVRPSELKSESVENGRRSSTKRGRERREVQPNEDIAALGAIAKACPGKIRPSWSRARAAVTGWVSDRRNDRTRKGCPTLGRDCALRNLCRQSADPKRWTPVVHEHVVPLVVAFCHEVGGVAQEREITTVGADLRLT